LAQCGHYTEEQKKYSIGPINEYGIRVTARILSIPRRTLQRWCRQYDINVKRFPEWVFEWAEKRNKKREFWQRRGYY
jgi:transposase-like protein